MTKIKPGQSVSWRTKKHYFNLKVRVIKAPLVDSNILREILAQRQKALVL